LKNQSIRSRIIYNSYLGNNSADELKVVEVVGVYVGEVVDGVGHPVSRTGLEQGVVGVKDLPGYNHVPFTK